MPRVLIAGCGALGLTLARQRQAQNLDIWGLRRRPPQQGPVHWLQGDLQQPESLAQLGTDWDVVLYTATPGERTESAYQRSYVQGLANLLDVLSDAFSGRLIYVSSTAVYGQDNGEWVSESSETRPQRFNGRILLAGEQLAMGRHADTTVARLGGIYGPGSSWLLQGVRQGRFLAAGAALQWSNRIHRLDAARALLWLMQSQREAGIYNVVDLQPALKPELLAWLGEQMQQQPAPWDAAGDYSGKRVSSQKLLDTGFELRYPDYRSGYGELMNDLSEQ